MYPPVFPTLQTERGMLLLWTKVLQVVLNRTSALPVSVQLIYPPSLGPARAAFAGPPGQ